MSKMIITTTVTQDHSGGRVRLATTFTQDGVMVRQRKSWMAVELMRDLNTKAFEDVHGSVLEELRWWKAQGELF